jgi:hypothetical protein
MDATSLLYFITVYEFLITLISDVSKIHWTVHKHTTHLNVVSFEVFMAVTMKNTVLWDVILCGSCKNQHFGGK